jgi:hypothetical protein
MAPAGGEDSGATSVFGREMRDDRGEDTIRQGADQINF